MKQATMPRRRTVDSAVAKLRKLEASTYRRDFREAARTAREVIEALSLTPAQRMTLLAQKISERTNQGRVVVYRTKTTGEVRVLGAKTAGVLRINPAQLVGTYDHGADWRDIRADLAA